MDFRRHLLLCTLLLSVGLSAQRSVSVTVTDTAGVALPFAELFVAETGRVAETDPRGRASLLLPDDGLTYTLTAFAAGYTTRQLTLGAGQSAGLRIVLRPLSRDLSAVTVVAEARRREALSRLRAVEGTAIYAGKKTEVVTLDALTVNLASNQARQIYAEIAGLNIYENDDAGLQLSIGGRGLDPNRSASFNTRQNGYDISADVLGYPESYYTPPAEALRKVEVIRGAASLQYGTQFGGLVNFVFREPNRQRKAELVSRQTAGSYGLLTSFNSLSGQVGKLGYYGFYNHKRGDGFRPNSGFRSHNAFLHLDYQLAPATRVSLEYTYLNYLAQQAGGLTDAQFYRDPLTSNRARNWFAVDWQLLSLRLDHDFSERTAFSLNLFGLAASREAVGFRSNRVSQTDDPTAPRDLLIGRFRNQGAEARLLHRYQIGQLDAVALIGTKVYRAENSAVQGPGTAEAGADFTLATEAYPAYPNQSSFAFPNRNVAVFAEHILQFTDRFSVTPGARFEYIRTESRGTYDRIDFDLAGNPIREEEFSDNRVFSRQLLLLGVGLSFLHSERFELFANLSENYRSVTFNDIRTVNPSFVVDPSISDESGFTADLGVRGTAGALRYNLNGFVIRYGDRLGEVLAPEVQQRADGTEVETGRLVRRRGNIGAALLYGLESLLEWDALQGATARKVPYSLTAYANTSLTDSRYTQSEIAGVAGNEVEFIPRLNLRAGLRFGWGDLLGSVQYSYLSRQFTDASNAAQDPADNQSGIVGTIPAYGVADLSLAYRWKALVLETGVNNFTDHRYFTRRATGYPGPGIIPSAPRSLYLTLGVTL